ncbi:Uncharacterized protein TCM_042646 [Theobroma cacao]|uniref:Uncharacterized protein n=1 Tax=Theobroma cacao TaxID=3641 RepID=A0A061FTH2_THECC|nr:Uncharacterized protein TCM_042646 [Theobroma cacao]
MDALLCFFLLEFSIGRCDRFKSRRRSHLTKSTRPLTDANKKIDQTMIDYNDWLCDQLDEGGTKFRKVVRRWLVTIEPINCPSHYPQPTHQQESIN